MKLETADNFAPEIEQDLRSVVDGDGGGGECEVNPGGRSGFGQRVGAGKLSKSEVELLTITGARWYCPRRADAIVAGPRVHAGVGVPLEELD